MHRLRWVQLVTSGVDRMASVLDPRYIWTSAKGAYSAPIAEFVLAALLSGLRSVPAYARARTWQPRPARSLRGLRVTIVGGGGIAVALARLLAPMECTVTAVRRTAAPVPGAGRTVQIGELSDVAASTDVLVLALALTPQTCGLVDLQLLDALSRGAWLVNVSRGAHVVTDDLVAALRVGRLGGAVLDVTDPEPLPRAHPLWSFDNCLITPHVACPPSIGGPLLLERIGENVRRFAAGEALLGAVDPAAGY
jgi:phosphoglycerate dehydrogenase-like enzyme